MDTRPTPLNRRIAHSFLLGFAVFLMGALLETLLHYLRTAWQWELVDNFISALLVGFVVFTYEQRRNNDLMQKLRVIESMNHHVRNALQGILLARYSASETEQIKIVHDGIDRIQWALREVLPGESGTSRGTWNR